MSAGLLLLPPAGEGGAKRRMRGVTAEATPGVFLVPGISHPTRLRRATFSRWREKEGTEAFSMILERPPRQLGRVRTMRGEPTKAEAMLWRALRDDAVGLKFRRQAPIGPHIADFACLPAKLVVELDRPPHETVERQAKDRARDAGFREHGWRVLRIPNESIFAYGGCDLLIARLRDLFARHPSSDPAAPGHLLPPAGEGGVP